MANKVLLLTDVPPCAEYTAGIALNNLAQLLPSDGLACYAVRTFVEDVDLPPQLAHIPYETKQVAPPNRRWLSHPNWLLRKPGHMAVSIAANYGRRFPNTRRLMAEIASFARASHVDRIWCLLESDPVIRLAAPLARLLGVPLYAQVFDPIDWWLRQFRFDPISRRGILRQFGDAIRMSQRCAAISDNMANDYRRDYGVETLSIMPTASAKIAQPPAVGLRNRGEISIAVAGQLYASQEWDALLAALDSVQWQVAGRRVKIRHFGKAAIPEVPGRHVEFAGWHSQENANVLLAESDLTYCPYWFDSAFKMESRQCFPSKLVCYLAAGRPVLVHAPEYASPAQFVSAVDAGACCHSLNAADIIVAIEGLVANEAQYIQRSRNARAAFEKHLSIERQRDRFLQFLDLPVSAWRMSA